MIQVCMKCGELVHQGNEHANDTQCLEAMKIKLSRIRKVMSTARFEIQRCRDKRHSGARIHPKLGACSNCFARGYAAFAIAGEVLLEPTAPEAKHN